MAPSRASGSNSLVISANRNALYDIFVAAGSPTQRVDVTLTINAGIVCGCGASGVAISTGTGWVAGSTITIINNGYIEGRGGAGNDGNGGNAIGLSWPVTINNTNGYIFGGGGGGSVGPTITDNFLPVSAGGGGGGGGQGNPGGAAGPGDGSATFPGSDGTAGSVSAPGTGGAPGSSGDFHGGGGGNGGAWGMAGDASGAASDGTRYYNVGSPGLAIYRGGYAVTWLGGYNSTQVKPYPVT